MRNGSVTNFDRGIALEGDGHSAEDVRLVGNVGQGLPSMELVLRLRGCIRYSMAMASFVSVASDTRYGKAKLL